MATYYWVGGSGTWNNTNATNWSTTSGGAGGAGVPTSADTVNFNASSGTSATITVTSTAASLSTVINKSDITLTLSGNVTLCQPTGTLTLTSGTLTLNSYTLTTGAFSSSTTSTRTINFDTGKIVVNGSTTRTVWTTSTNTNLTVNGTEPLVEFKGGGAGVTKTITTGILSEEKSISFSFLETGGTVTYSIGAARIRNLLVNGVQTITHTGVTIYGSYTLLNTNGNTTYTASTSAWTFAGTSGPYTISGSTSTHDFPWTFNGVGGSWTLQSNIATGSSRIWTLTNGTIDFANYIITGSSISIGAGTPIVKNLDTALNITIATTTANLTLGTDCTTTGTLTMTGGRFSLDTYALTVRSISSSGAGTKIMDFGTSGKIVINSSTTATIITGTNTGLTVLGTNPLMECLGGGTGVTKTISTGALTENNSISISLLETTGSVTYTITSGSVVRDLTLNGTQTLTNNTRTIYGNFTNLTTNGTTTINGGSNATTFASTSGTKTITSSGATIDFTFIFSGVGGTWALQDALTLGSTRYATLTNGTLDLNGYTLTAFGASIAAGTRNLTFNGGTFVVLGSGTTCWINPSPTGFTTTQGSAPGTINMTSSTAKTFEGGGVTYYATLNQGGTGDLTITGNNTFNDITGTITSTNPAVINFTAGTTTTLLSFTGTGTSSTNTLKLRSFTTGAVKPTGTAIIYGSVNTGVDYLLCEYIDFTPFIVDGTSPSYSWFIGSNSLLYNCSGALVVNYDSTLVVYVIHTGTSWTVPSDFNSSNNTIHLFGGGAAGGAHQLAPSTINGAGGGGGGYTKIDNYSASPSTNIAYSVGLGGVPSSNVSLLAGTNTVFDIYSAGGGGFANTGGVGGIGLTANGGNGGLNSSNSSQNFPGAGGGGAGGPFGVGGDGGSILNYTGYVNQSRGGAGGGGSGGGASVSNTSTSSNTGSGGGNNYFGVGGAPASALNAVYDGSYGGGGAGGFGGTASTNGGYGGKGTDILNSIGPGGGGGGGGINISAAGTGGNGGLYGGGGGGGTSAGINPTRSVGGSGGNGGIIIVYYTGTAVATTGNMFLMF